MPFNHWLYVHAYTLWGFIKEIPSTFWAVVVSTLFTVFTVHLTNSHHAKRLDKQLENDRELKRIERVFNAKRDIYMDAAVALTVSIRSLHNYALLDMPHVDLMKEAIEKNSALAKINLMATPETLRALGAVNLAIADAVMKLTEMRKPLIDERGVLLVEEQSYKNYQKRFEGLLDLQHQITLDGQRPEGEFARVARLTEGYMDQANKARTRWAEHDRELRIKAMAIYQESLRRVQGIGALTPRLIESIRAELDTSIDMAAFHEMFGMSAAKMDEVGKRLASLQSGETAIQA